MNFKKGALIAVLIVLAALPFASANWLDLLTGQVTSAETNVTAQVVSNNVPVITNVTCDQSNCASINLVEGSIKNVTFNVTVFDFDGSIDLNLSYTFVNVTYPVTCNGQNRNRNAACFNLTPQSFGQYLNFTCLVQFQYYDCAGDWIVNVTTRDLYNVTSNWSRNITLNALNAVDIYPFAIDFPALTVLSQNRSSNLNTTVNNTGNTLAGLLTLNSTNLVGNINTQYALNASNFTSLAFNVSAPASYSPCNITFSAGSYLTNYSFFDVGNVSTGRGAVPRVNIDGGHPGQYVMNKYCIPLVPMLPRQNYTTDAEGKWTLKANF